jgi:hypothetical protein
MKNCKMLQVIILIPSVHSFRKLDTFRGIKKFQTLSYSAQKKVLCIELTSTYKHPTSESLATHTHYFELRHMCMYSISYSSVVRINQTFSNDDTQKRS